MLSKTITTALIILQTLTSNLPTALNINYKGKFESYGPAFLSITKFHNSAKFLLFSSFGAASYSRLYIVPEISEQTSTEKKISEIKPIEITNNFTWINFPKVVPFEIFKNRSLLIKDGFIPPFHNNGGVYILIINENDITKVEKTLRLTAEKKGYYYHEAFWYDFNKDGKMDLITARSNSKKEGSELLWLEQPENYLEHSGPWKEHIIYRGGTDISFSLFETSILEGILVIFSGEFWGKKATVMYFDLKLLQIVERRVIDDSIGFVYAAQVVELNGDGKKQLLVNNHEKKDEDTGIWIYDFPEDFDFIHGEFKKTKIAGDFKNASSFFIKNMSPGFPYVVWPKVEEKGEKMANIVVAGDGDYTAHLMSPRGKGDYGIEDIKFLGGTVGSICFDDLDGDGLLDLFIPNYDQNYIEFYRFEEKNEEVVAEEI